MTDRITRATLDARLANLNRRFEACGSIYRWAVQGHSGSTWLYRDDTHGNRIATITGGTKREIADYLNIAMNALDDAATCEDDDHAQSAVLAADQHGYDHGLAAGSWVIDGNTTTETARRIVRGYDDGDPEIMDMQPAPLSGEWADSPLPRDVLSAVGLEQDDDAADDALSAYEDGYGRGYWQQVLAAARTLAGGEDADQ